MTTKITWIKVKNCFFRLALTAAALGIVALLTDVAVADEIRIERDGKTVHCKGKIVVEAQDGGLLFLSTDGRLWLVQPDEIKKKQQTEQAEKPLDADTMAAEMLKDLPKGFAVHSTKHFVICYNTSLAYAKWVGSIYERLYRGFHSYWTKKRRWSIGVPDRPLPIILFKTKEEYARYVKKELGQEVGSMVAYYNLLTNRVAMYDLTGMGSPTDVQIRNFISTPNAMPMIATVVHEGTHQLIFNTGIQTRLADTPLWVNEGLAMFFETPDLKSRTGWRKIGAINRPRLLQFRANLSKGKIFSVEDLIGDDRAFRDGKHASDAYAQAWAMNYYLFTKHSKKYVKFLQELAKKKPLMIGDREQRISEFKAVFGDDLDDFQKAFVGHIKRLK